MQRMATFSGALHRLRAIAHLKLGDEWFEANDIGAKTYLELVAAIRATDLGAAIQGEFVRGFATGMAKAADESGYQKVRLPDGTEIDRESAIRQNKAQNDLVTSWGNHFIKKDPADPKNFASFEGGLPGVGLALIASGLWVSGVGAGMLLLGGTPGTGKTHLAKASYAYLDAEGRYVFYRREVDLISDLQRSIQDHNVEAVMEEIQGCPWLIIDDYGAAASGPWGRGQMDAIIDARWESAGNLRTMITTNLDAEGMKAQSLRIWSRLSDRTRANRVAMGADAEDYREKRGS